MHRIVLEFGIAASHLIWRYRTRKLHRKAKGLGIPFDELVEARPYQRGEKKDFELERDSSDRLSTRPGAAMA